MALLLFVCVLFWGAHKSLAPRARTLLGVLGQATLSFFAVATLLFFVFCECPKFCDLAKQRRKIFGGVSEVRKADFSPYFFWLCVFFLIFFNFSLLGPVGNEGEDAGSGIGVVCALSLVSRVGAAAGAVGGVMCGTWWRSGVVALSRLRG